jgi:hypothetical protein
MNFYKVIRSRNFEGGGGKLDSNGLGPQIVVASRVEVDSQNCKVIASIRSGDRKGLNQVRDGSRAILFGGGGGLLARSLCSLSLRRRSTGRGSSKRRR